MGRGDVRTKKGKIKAGSFGNARPRTANIKPSATAAVVTEAAAPKAKKAPAKKKEEA
jgi:ribosomal small subunit protein bTHX